MKMNQGKGQLQDYVDFFKGLSENTRLRIVWILLQARCSLCVCEIMDALNESQYNVSRHLKILKNAGIVTEERSGKWIFYAIPEPEPFFQQQIFSGVRFIPKILLDSDATRLEKRLSLRKDQKCVIGLNSKVWQGQLRKAPKTNAEKRG